MTTRRTIRRSIGNYRYKGKKLLQLYGTATGAGSGTVDLAELAAYPVDAKLFDMYGVSNITDSTDGIVTAFTQASNRLTFAPVGTWTGDLVELWQPGLDATIVNGYIDKAIDLIREEALREQAYSSVAYSAAKSEYVIPSGYKYLHRVSYYSKGVGVGLSVDEMDTWRALKDATARTKLGQGFQLEAEGLYRGFVVFLRKQGTISPAQTITGRIETNSSGVPSDSVVAGATTTRSSDLIPTDDGHYIFFDWERPVLLSAATQYHITLATSGSADASNYFEWAEDNDNKYDDGALSVHNNTSWSAVAGSDMAFYLIPYGGSWEDLHGHEWDISSYNQTDHRLRILRAKGQWLANSEVGYYPEISDGTPLMVVGLERAALSADDNTTDIEVPRIYVEAMALAMLLRDLDPGLTEQVNFLELSAKRDLESHPIRTWLPVNSRLVAASGAG